MIFHKNSSWHASCLQENAAREHFIQVPLLSKRKNAADKGKTSDEPANHTNEKEKP